MYTCKEAGEAHGTHHPPTLAHLQLLHQHRVLLRKAGARPSGGAGPARRPRLRAVVAAAAVAGRGGPVVPGQGGPQRQPRALQGGVVGEALPQQTPAARQVQGAAGGGCGRGRGVQWGGRGAGRRAGCVRRGVGRSLPERHDMQRCAGVETALRLAAALRAGRRRARRLGACRGPPLPKAVAGGQLIACQGYVDSWRQ